ncbi:hypothetical protein BAC3_00876 [uncultured bacterium]|nr:hypothetical protein BAC3_00876 [uncultured bacterium]
MDYWIVRSKWGAISKKADFINNDEWINGYDDKYLEIVKRVQTEDILLLAEESSITHYAQCVDNPQDGKHLTVDKWNILKNAINFPAKTTYNKAIAKINDDELISTVKHEIEQTIASNDIKIKSIAIENFTVFKNEQFKFSDGLNVIVGENGIGKTHLIKMLYSIIISISSANNSYGCPADHYDYYEGREIPTYAEATSEIIESKLLNVFKADIFDNLISYNESNGLISINFGDFFIKFHLNKSNDYLPIVVEEYLSAYFSKENCIFIPAKEILSFYEGFIALYENRETSFDEIYYNLARSLSLPVLKNIEHYPVEYKILLKLEEILEGKMSLENGRFYLIQNNRKTEISLIAEGLRKIGMIAQLIANGSLNKNSILFWDEPETNLNPKLIKKMAELLVELSRAGMQIFIATHSLFLIKELEILRNKDDQFKYFGLGFHKGEVRVSQNEDFEYLDDIVVLDEALKQNDRFLKKRGK